jgi:hypothetical protein
MNLHVQIQGNNEIKIILEGIKNEQEFD